MSATVADQVYARVTALTGADPGMTRASAIRAVSAEMGRSVPATSSAFYAGAKRAEVAGAPSAPTRGRRTAVAGHPDAPALYAEMLPLIEAGATVEQAAPPVRRRGDRRRDRRRILTVARARAPGSVARPGRRRAGRRAARLASAEAENRILRGELTRARQALSRVRAIVESVPDPERSGARRAYRPERSQVRCSSAVRSAAGRRSSRASEIGSPLSTLRPYVPSARRTSARARARAPPPARRSAPRRALAR